MADPLGVCASVVTVAIAAVQSINSLCQTVKRYQGRDKTLKRLHDELQDLINILNQLKEVVVAHENSTLKLLKDPIARCHELCGEFEEAMKSFGGKSKTGLKDWARMEFMRGDINTFIDTLGGYKSTIAIGLGTITMSVAYFVCLGLY
jgi:DNA-binding FrmR family transcriptional regulator